MSKGRSRRSTEVADPEVSWGSGSCILLRRSLGMSNGKSSVRSEVLFFPIRDSIEIPLSDPWWISWSKHSPRLMRFLF